MSDTSVLSQLTFCFGNHSIKNPCHIVVDIFIFNASSDVERCLSLRTQIFTCQTCAGTEVGEGYILGKKTNFETSMKKKGLIFF